MTVASGSSCSTSAARAASSSRTAPDSATITGSITTGVPGSSCAERLADGGDRLRRPEHPDLDRVDADVLCHLPHLLDDHLRRRRVNRADPGRVLGGQTR